MNILISIKLNRLNNELHYQFHNDVIDIFNSRDNSALTILDLNRWLAPYLVAFEGEKEVLDIILKSKFTLLMMEMDRNRDKSCRGLISVLKSILHFHSELAMRESAQRVLDVLKHYGDITRRKYDEETAAIEDVMREFENEDIKADLTKLKVTEWTEKMVMYNNYFKEYAAQRNLESAHRPLVRMKETRVETDRMFRNIVKHIEYKMISDFFENVPPEMTELIRELNAKITHYKNVVARSKTRPEVE